MSVHLIPGCFHKSRFFEASSKPGPSISEYFGTELHTDVPQDIVSGVSDDFHDSVSSRCPATSMSRFSLQQCFLLRLFPGQVARLGFVCSSTAAGAGNSSEHRHREQQRAQVQGAAASTDAGSSQHSAGHSRTPHRSRDQYGFWSDDLKLSSLLCRISSLLAQLSINSRSSSNVYRDSESYRPCSIIFR